MRRSLKWAATAAGVLAAGAILYVFISGKPAGGIHPGTVTSAPTIPSAAPGDGPYAYRTFDRNEILTRLGDDPRFEALVDRAKDEAAGIVGKSDGEVRALIGPAGMKRAFMVHRSGCPVHGGGTGVYLPFGTSVDLDHPGRVRCPIGGELYPNAEFPDDGDGWLDDRPGSPTKGERFYFRGWFQHWFLQTVGARVKTLAQLWLVTGEDVYRHKAEVLIERFAEVYPDIDSEDLTYSGADWGVYVKTTGSYWEGTTLLNFAKGVEILSPVLSAGLLDMVAENVYRAAFEAYRAKPASSNWGNNWNPPLAKFAVILRDPAMLDFMMHDHPAAEAPVLDNQFFRDGFPFEASLSYASTYHNVAMNVADALGETGRWIWDHPHMRESWRSFADLVCLDRFTHFAADMGGLRNAGWTLPVSGIEQAWRAYRTPHLARYLLQAMDVQGAGGPRSLDDLFEDPLDIEAVAEAAAKAPPLAGTTGAVRGIAVLRRGKGDDRAALVFDYGYAHRAHSHADRLNINLFAHGRELIPEMGYPEYMDHIAPATGGWTTHTVCHATVEVDEKRQAPGVFGDLAAFVETDGLSFVDACCEDAYVHRDIGRYRRTLALVDTPSHWYVLDIFRVKGGDTRDYLFHGPPVDVELTGVELPPPREGTLAGEDVPFASAPNGIEPYDIDNSGYQYLFDVREAPLLSPCAARWRMEDGLVFTALFLPKDRETLIRTSGYPRPSTKSLPPMPFLVRRSEGAVSGGETCFVTVLSVGRGAPVVHSAELLDLDPSCAPSSLAVRIRHADGEDILLSAVGPGETVRTADGRFSMTGMFGAAAFVDGNLVRTTLIGGTEFTANGQILKLDAPFVTAAIRDVYDDRLVLDRPLPEEVSGAFLLADRGAVRSVYRAGGVDGDTVGISPSPWIGRGRVGAVDVSGRSITDGRNIFPLGESFSGARNYYGGAWIATPSGDACYRLSSGGNRGFILDGSRTIGDLASEFPEDGGEFLLYDVGPGDRVTWTAHASWRAR